ncbi:parallel beta helix pectate lyase-like protein [Amycolatopsis sulphurea]|uniref:Parallel beta helix pectate lyase-like protein n=1 Tax=Amycolatopsis sulphurea TaxID=76022 RepID=A0A2A9F6T2_9PSEU|nr:right-handed parallel beta-helix repeat-containing protein [Amycolatopsis sulphurea]PFG46471.1 parallel beta helix pectate lyase-like protein [Amycolatopsis sulphurea]
MKAPILLGAAMLAVPFVTTAPFTTSPSCSQSALPQGVVCAAGRLKITKGGTPGWPLTYAGQGRQVNGIDVEADNVVVDGYTMDGPKAPGIEIHGSNVTVRNTTIKAPKGGDGDGIRFFGDNIGILHNTISDTDNSTGAHADCMQTFATDDEDVASRNVDIENNRCERIDNMCLMAESPNSEAGDGNGEGVSEDWTFKGNYCETKQASQAVMIDDVQNLSLEGNTWAAGPDHAIGLQNKSTGAHVKDNELDPSIKCEVGIDKSARKGYQGPEPKCEP